MLTTLSSLGGIIATLSISGSEVAQRLRPGPRHPPPTR